MNDSAVTNAAPNGFLLGNFLTQELGTVVGTDFARLWIDLGGEREDDGYRSRNHFHDPLKSSWSNAGLYFLLSHFESSAVWMQDDDGGDAGSGAQGWSWPDARRSYYDALTLCDRGDRQQKLADTFRAVGQIMHLVEDAAQPAHVRNDTHIVEAICRERLGISCDPNFESWVEDNRGDISFDPVAANPRFDRAILSQTTGHDEAPVPVARLIDIDRYDGSDPNVTWPNAAIGIAEFTNANFFSEDTVPFFGVGPYRFPSVIGMTPSTKQAGSGYLRRYYAKATGDGIPLDPAVVVSAWAIVLPVSYTGAAFVLAGTTDDNVYTAMAPILIPKAVDYAQGALEYFFRGKLIFCHGGRGGFSVIQNVGQDSLHGMFSLYYDDADGNRQPGGQWSTGDYLPASANGWLAPNAVMRVQDGDLPTDPPPVSYTLVFNGDMGIPGAGVETLDSSSPVGAVAAKVIVASQQCQQKLWVASDSDGIVAYDLGLNGLPDAATATSLGVSAQAVAFDRLDGNLWYTNAGGPGTDNMLHKITPDGTPVTDVPVAGTLPDENGDFSGFAAMDVDPYDPSFVWLSAWLSVSVGTWGLDDWVPFYKVRTSDGQVVHTCIIRRGDGSPVYTSGSGGPLATAKSSWGSTVVFTAPNASYWPNRVFGYEGTSCYPVDTWDFLPLPLGPNTLAMNAMAQNGAGDWIVFMEVNPAPPTEDSVYTIFYLFGSPFGQIFYQPLAAAPGPDFSSGSGDIALGVLAGFPAAPTP